MHYFLSKLPSNKIIKHMFFSFIIEFFPIVTFLIFYSSLHIYKDTFLLMIMTIISTYVTFKTQKRIPYVGMYTSLLTVTFGFITISYHLPKFVQIRDTIFDLTCALTLATALIFEKNILYETLNQSIPMTRRAWINITHAWIVMYITNAVVNEIVRRHFDFHVWIQYKSWAVFVFIIYGLVTGYIFYKPEGHK